MPGEWNNPNAVRRTIRLLRAPKEGAPGLFFVNVGEWSAYYVFVELPCEIGGRGFEVLRVGTRRRYHVRVGKARDCSCECRGFTYRRRCRHVAGLRMLVRRGII